ncbi:MAG: histidinol dehydrogenase [Candidatus Wallbacteria bacterium]|nr:histidinol dehydrogenase [Candidatus Wallbacteria bacterium]
MKKILLRVSMDGDEALTEYTRRFDDVEIEDFRVGPEQIREAFLATGSEIIHTLKTCAENIEKFALLQLDQCRSFEAELLPGVFTGQKVIPIGRAGIYVPGGNYPLVSTLLMCSIPARVAGVGKIAVFSPPSYEGSVHPLILAAAELAGVDEVYRLGGAQAIAAMAYGTASIPKVDLIAGPGNKYVTAAKKLVYGSVGVDMIAGPTEVLIIADDSADPALLAADLLGQAEHDLEATPVLVTDSETLVASVKLEIEQQLCKLQTEQIARKSIAENGIVILVDDLFEAVEAANRKAPEHLELQVREPDRYISGLRNYGSLFIGEFAAEVLGDYSSGLNHTLPTNGAARFTGGLSVRNFLKFQTTLRMERKGLSVIGPAAQKMGGIEGLAGHAESVRKRLEKAGLSEK